MKPNTNFIIIIKFTGKKVNKKYMIIIICLKIKDWNNFFMINVLSSGVVNENDWDLIIIM